MKFEPYIFVSYGLLIVFSGLSFLAIAVSNIHNLISFFGKVDIKKRIRNNKNKKTPPVSQGLIFEMGDFLILSNPENQAFSLPELIEKGKKSGMENPWEIIDVMIKKDIIIPDNKGRFLWNMDSSCYRKIEKLRTE